MWTDTLSETALIQFDSCAEENKEDNEDNKRQQSLCGNVVWQELDQQPRAIRSTTGLAVWQSPDWFNPDSFRFNYLCRFRLRVPFGINF